jgi:cyanophycinase
MIPKGKLIAIGGAEDKGTDLEAGIIKRSQLNFFEIGILKTISNMLADKGDRIEIITTASSVPEEVGVQYITAFNKLGCSNVGHLNIRVRDEVLEQANIDRLKACKAVLFSGGNQLRLSSIFGGTEFLDILKQRYEDEYFLIAGTSAGAMAMSLTMIYEGNASNAHLKGEVKMTTGLGFISGVIIDSHFNKRGRFARLAQAVAANPGAIGIGLGEDTGIIVRNGEELHAIGSGSVMILDGRNIHYNNIADIEFDEPISVENIIVHLMAKGNIYNIRTRKFQGAEVVVKPAE